MSATTRFTVTLVHPGQAPVRFAAGDGHSIVKSAAAAGVMLTTGCLQGRCAICRARLLSGTVRAFRRASPNAAGSPLQRPDGCVLPCSLAPSSDVVLETLSPWHRRDAG